MRSKTQRTRRNHMRRGIASMLAMLFLVLFATLAIGFYASTDMSSQVASNEEHVARAFVASESGLEFIKYELANVDIPPNTAPDMVIDELYSDLQSQLNSTGNLGSLTISKTGNVISIPGTTDGKIKLDSAGRSSFRITITNWAGQIVAKSQGFYGGTSAAGRAISMDFSREEKTTTVFDFAVASKGQVVISGGSLTSAAGVDPKIAAVMSAKPAANSLAISATVGGDLSLVAGGSAAIGGGAKVGGSSSTADILSNHVHEVDPPEFPTIDTTVYKEYVVNTYGPGIPLKNIYIPAGTTKKFAGNQTIQGIMYIQAPCSIEFAGNVNLQGFIVIEPAVAGNNNLKFTGSVNMSPVPNGTEFDALRATTGVAILAPDTNVTVWGSAGSGDNSIKGSILSKTFTSGGASNLLIDQGTIMTFSPDAGSFLKSGPKSIKFSATGANNKPKLGVSYSTYYSPVPGSYQEVMP